MTPSPIITTYANAGLTYVIKAIVIVSYPSPVIFGDLVILKWAAGCSWRSTVGGGAAKGLHSFLPGGRGLGGSACLQGFGSSCQVWRPRRFKRCLSLWWISVFLASSPWKRWFGWWRESLIMLYFGCSCYFVMPSRLSLLSNCHLTCLCFCTDPPVITLW